MALITSVTAQSDGSWVAEGKYKGVTVIAEGDTEKAARDQWFKCAADGAVRRTWLVDDAAGAQ